MNATVNNETCAIEFYVIAGVCLSIALIDEPESIRKLID
jgi:hypothetical protein